MTAVMNSESDETRPLLPSQAGEDPDSIHKKSVTPLPKAQLTVVTCIRLVEPIAYTQIFPYINQYLGDLHVTDDPKRIGFYSGLVESTFAIFQLVSIYSLAKLSDKIGRRPVVLWGNAGVAIATFLFGLSTNLPEMLVFRALAGLCSGNASVMHSVLGELTDSSNFGIALPIYSLGWPSGVVLGPMLGGTLSNPADKFHWLDFSFLRSHPYFLPGCIASLLTLLAVFIGFFVMRETLPRKVLAAKRLASDPIIDIHKAPVPEESAGIKDLLFNPAIFLLCTSGFALSFISAGFQVIFVLFCYTSIDNGGLALSTELIGYSLSTSGIISLLLQLIIMPYLVRNFNKAKMYNLCFWMFPCLFPLLAILNVLAQRAQDKTTGELSPHATAIIWIGIAVVLAMSRFASLAFGFNVILIKEHCPNSASLGMSNGIVQFTMCLARAFSPALMSSIFTLSVEYNILGGFAWVLAMFVIGMAGVSQSAYFARVSG